MNETRKPKVTFIIQPVCGLERLKYGLYVRLFPISEARPLGRVDYKDQARKIINGFITEVLGYFGIDNTYDIEIEDYT